MGNLKISILSPHLVHIRRQVVRLETKAARIVSFHDRYNLRLSSLTSPDPSSLWLARRYQLQWGFKQSGLAKSETGLVKKNGALLDRCNVNLFARARRLHFIGRKKSGKQEALGFMVDSFTTLFLKIVAQGYGMRSVG